MSGKLPEHILALIEIERRRAQEPYDRVITLLEQVKPDVLVKGGDYSVEEVVGHEFVKRYGGEVKVLDFIDDISTTKIVERIKKDNE